MSELSRVLYSCAPIATSATTPEVGSPPMQLLYPECRATSPNELASGLRLGDKAPADRPYLVLNMVSSLDGKATIDWRTKGLSTDLDRQLFHRLRTQSFPVKGLCGVRLLLGHGSTLSLSGQPSTRYEA